MAGELAKQRRAALALWLALAAPHAAAQAYPDRPVRMVVPFTAGGTLDVVARTLVAPVSAQLGQTLIVDNRAGANGVIGDETVARAAPDGHTMLMTTSAIAINPSINRKLPYDVVKDFAPVTPVGRGAGYFVLLHPSVPAKTVQELIALAKKGDAPMSYASAGVGNTLHLVAEVFLHHAKIRMLHVPYKGAGPATNAVLAGEVQMLVAPPTVTLQHVKNGRLRAVGFTAKSRWSFLPDVPTMVEAGLRDFHYEPGWMGWFMPARTPEARVERMHAAFVAAAQNPAVRDAMVAAGYEPWGMPPREFRGFVAQEVKRYAEVVRIAGVKPE